MGKNKDKNTKTNIRHRQKQIRKFKDKRKTYMAENKGSLIHKGNRPPPSPGGTFELELAQPLQLLFDSC